MGIHCAQRFTVTLPHINLHWIALRPEEATSVAHAASLILQTSYVYNAVVNITKPVFVLQGSHMKTQHMTLSMTYICSALLFGSIIKMHVVISYK